MAICGVCLYTWTSAFQRFRLTRDTPASRIASAAQGYVEFSGRAERHPEFNTVSYVRSLPCCWCRYKVERKDGDNWVVDAEGETSDTFAIVDATGRCVIDPDGAEVITTHKETWISDGFRYTESLLLSAEPLYAIGDLVTLSGANADYDMREETGKILAEWKQDRATLLDRFDTNKDGEIDMAEWEQVRDAADKEVAVRRHATFSHEVRELNLLRKPGDGRLFLLSNLPAEKLTRTYRYWAWFHLTLLFAAVVFGAHAYRQL